MFVFYYPPKENNLVIEKLEFDHVEYREDLLSRLRGNIFHVTNAFEQIQSDGAIRNNKDGRLGINICTGMSFARERGWVSLFDFRGITEETIEFTLGYYNFLGPSWFKVDTPDCSEYELNFAYLFLTQEEFSKIISNDFALRAHRQGEQYRKYVPRTECWYPGDVTLRYIDTALLVKVRQSNGKHTQILKLAYASLAEELGAPNSSLLQERNKS